MDETPEQQREAARQKALALANPRCPHCGAALSRHQAVSPGHCGSPPCVSRHLGQVSDAREAARTAETEARRGLARELAGETLSDMAMMLGATPADALVAPMPFQNKPVIPLPEERRAAFEAHLEDILAQAFDTDEDAFLTARPSNPGAEPPIVDAACAACQGMCCARGGGEAHAFLTPQALVHLIRADATLTAEAMRADYLAALPEASVEDACVYQSSEGCTLPRARRASLCNSFYCHDIYALQDQTGGRSDVPVLLVGMAEDVPQKAIAFDARMGGMVLTEMLDI